MLLFIFIDTLRSHNQIYSTGESHDSIFIFNLLNYIP